jgi:glycosyltransferase involved in cell wall biosynthesis
MAENKTYDVCLLLEGTYPFVAGGVSEWVHHLVEHLEDISFTAVCILPSIKESEKLKYDPPENLKDIKIVTLYEESPDLKKSTGKGNRKKQIELLRSFHGDMKKDKYGLYGDVMSVFRDAKGKGLTPHDMLYSRESWDFLLDLYGPEENEDSFIDYFWTFRITHLPVFKLLNAGIPQAKVYHAISTGYAGFIGTMAKHVTGRPFLLTEHGIYTRERKIDIMQTEWIHDPDRGKRRIKRAPGQFQKIWISLFERLGKIAYDNADSILTVCEANREQQIAQGAEPGKTEVIPNGIDVDRFADIYDWKSKSGDGQGRPLTVGFVGRVVPIKDIKTFIRACRIVKLRFPELRIFIMGPRDEDPGYYRECLDLVRTLDMGDSITFTGNVDVRDYFLAIDIIVLTSISEAQPLIILEANCAGIPVVATDVGACREMLEGREEKDRQIGPSGIVTGIADPNGTAQGITALLGDSDLKRTMGAAGHRRVHSFYQEKELHSKYREIYEGLID